MRKILILSMLILFSLQQISSEELEKEAVIFEKYEESVVYITQSLYFNSKNVENFELFERVEDKYKVTILDNNFTLSSGTGFFITGDGYILTNHHVTARDKLAEIKRNMYKSLINDFFSKIPESVISSSEYDRLKADLKELVYNSEFSYQILVNNSDSFEAKLLKSDADLDVALLKVNSEESFKPIPLGDSDSLKVGNFVMAIGYPVPSSLFHAVKDFKSSMTSGRVSAIRTDNWGIQHTSSISPGNSGGPLFNSSGEIIGINVGAVTTGNDLFFSIPVSKVIKWLGKTRYSELVNQNRDEAKGLGKKYALNKDGYLEVGETLLVNLSDEYRVYIDGKFKGNPPLLLESLKAGKHTIRIESENEYLEQKLLVKRDISDILDYQPELNRYTGKLFVSSQPLGADLYLDAKKIGKTPFVVNDLTVGKYKLTVKKEGYLENSKEVSIKREETTKESLSLEKGYKILFNITLPKDALITVEGKSGTDEFKRDELILLPAGEWKITVSGESFKEKSFELVLEDADEILEIELERYSSIIRLENLNAGSTVYIDNEEVTSKVEDKTLSLEVGSYELKVKAEGYKDFVRDIGVEKGKETEIEISYEPSPEKYEPYKKASRSLFIVGGITTMGFVMFPIGLVINLNAEQIAFYNMEGANLMASFSGTSSLDGVTSYYNRYLAIKASSLAFFYTGVVLSSVSLISFAIAIPLYIYYLKKTGNMKGFKKNRASLLFDINEHEAITGVVINL